MSETVPTGSQAFFSTAGAFSTARSGELPAWFSFWFSGCCHLRFGVTGRMKRDFAKLDVPTNPGFQAGRTTTSSIFPLRLAAEDCKATATEMSALLGDRKWCFDPNPGAAYVATCTTRDQGSLVYENVNRRTDENITSKPAAMPECPWVSDIRQGQLRIHKPHRRNRHV